MKTEKDIPSTIFVGFIIFLILATFALKVIGETRREKSGACLWQRPDGRSPICVIQVRRQDDSCAALLSGYNYHLLELFSQHTGVRFDIRLADREEDCTDSLRSGAIDMLVIPYRIEGTPEGLISTGNLDSTSVWLFKNGDAGRLREADEWIKHYRSSGTSVSVKKRFFEVYDPVSKSVRSRSHLSPYDNIIKAYADSIDWDWRLLAAVIYHESHFKLEVVSRRGATGLMQIMPDAESGKDLVNPDNNIRTGALMLGALTRRYRGIAQDPAERQKLALAAYNAGTGRMRDVLNFASYKGVERSCWDSLAAMIPQMRDSVNIAESGTVKLGVFKGVETLSYVENIMKTYEVFKNTVSE